MITRLSRPPALLLCLACVPLFCLPETSPAEEAPPVRAESNSSTVVGLTFRGRHRAYSLEHFPSPRVLNDSIGRQEVAIFFDPDNGTASAFFRMVLGEPIEFSGDVVEAVADDLTTMTRWDMETGKAVAGNLLGMELVPLPITRTSWAEWFGSHPDTSLFSPESR